MGRAMGTDQRGPCAPHAVRHRGLTVLPQTSYSGRMSTLSGSGEAIRAAAAQQPPRISLISKPGCHLCVLAKEVVGRVADDLGMPWQELDITTLTDPDPRWWEQLPVTLVDGGVHDYWRVDERRLREALAMPAPPA